VTDPASRPLDRRQVAAARLWAAHRFPYLASALFAAPVLETPGSGGVAADPSWRMYVDPDAIADWSPDELGSVMVHLVGHFLRDHGERAQAAGVSESDAAHWTDAADAEINDDFGSDPPGPDRARDRDGGRRRGDDGGELHFPERPVLPEDLGCERGGLAERYFAEGSRREADCWACASAADGQGRPWEGQDGPSGVGRNGQQLLRRQVAGEVLARQRQAGNVPEGLRRWAEDVLGARVDWRKTLAAELRRGITEVAGAVDYSYRRPSRRSTVAGDVVLPSLRRPVPHVAVVCDTSGSMSQSDLGRVLAEVDGVLRAVGVGSTAVRVLAVDAAVHTAQRVTSARQVELLGGGGTNMGVGIEAAARLRPRPQVVVVLTDGETPWPPAPPPGVRVIVGLIGPRPPEPPAWTRAVRVDPEP
jgi:predicted metal-dependent peptidase